MILNTIKMANSEKDNKLLKSHGKVKEYFLKMGK